MILSTIITSNTAPGERAATATLIAPGIIRLNFGSNITDAIGAGMRLADELGWQDWVLKFEYRKSLIIKTK